MSLHICTKNTHLHLATRTKSYCLSVFNFSLHFNVFNSKFKALKAIHAHHTTHYMPACRMFNTGHAIVTMAWLACYLLSASFFCLLLIFLIKLPSSSSCHLLCLAIISLSALCSLFMSHTFPTLPTACSPLQNLVKTLV